MHWGQRRVSCYTGHTAPLHSLSKFSVSVFSISKVIHLPTQQKGRMVVFKDDEPLVEVLRACLAQGAPHKAVCCLPQLKTVGKQPQRAPTVSHRSALQSTVCSHSAHLAWRWQAGTTWMRGKLIPIASSSESKHDIF